eukprot:m.199072 g.199072  ORF g.199072 m.199072 type:complete len:73 (-) comp53801_c0_seq6:264-482(-)
MRRKLGSATASPFCRLFLFVGQLTIRYFHEFSDVELSFSSSFSVSCMPQKEIPDVLKGTIHHPTVALRQCKR